MANRWIGRVIVLTGFEDAGRLRVVETGDHSVGCVPMDADSTVGRLADMGGDGVLWIAKRDTTECPTQEETLL